jgi:hypothetical protein
MGEPQNGLEYEVDIGIPTETDEMYSLGFYSQDGKIKGVIDPSIKKGLIELTILGMPSRHDFFITQMPSREYSLYGFYIDSSNICSINVDTWKEGKPFHLFCSKPSSFIVGNCE